MVLVMSLADMQEMMGDLLIVLVSHELTKKVEVDMWGSHYVQMVGLLVDLVSAMAQETIGEVGDMSQESMKPHIGGGGVDWGSKECLWVGVWVQGNW